MYTKVHKMMMQETVKDYIPYSWISMVLVKSQHFKARAHHYAAIAIVGPSMNQKWNVVRLPCKTLIQVGREGEQTHIYQYC